MGETKSMSTFEEACQAAGLTPEDVARYGCGFQDPRSGLPTQRVDIILHNKSAITTLMSNPTLLAELSAALSSFSLGSTEQS